MRVESLWVYPFKSAAGISVREIEVDAAGLRGDRAWMAVDRDGKFVSLRSHPRMAFLSATIRGEAVQLDAPGVESLTLTPTSPSAEGFESVRVWFSDRCAVDCGDEPAEWFSDFIGERCRVVRSVRPDGLPLLSDEGRVHASFADASPALVISTASLDDLNGRLEAPLPMSRFRPNVVVSGFDAYGEDAWGSRRVGVVETRARNQCQRCAATLLDGETGEKGEEPLRTLATYRRDAEGEVVFGMNVLFESAGTLRVGDVVTGGSATR